MTIDEALIEIGSPTNTHTVFKPEAQMFDMLKAQERRWEMLAKVLREICLHQRIAIDVDRETKNEQA